VNVLSLFTGIGGIDLGCERAGMTVVGQVEIDPYCQAVLARHWPGVPRHNDVCTAVAWWRSERRPAIDVVAGGFPCQPVSNAGKKLGTADKRWLWPAMAAIIRDLRPHYALMENVPGLLGRGMGDVLGDLATFGYDSQWDCISAHAVGAPHRRDRIFIIAYPQSDRWREGGPGRSLSGDTNRTSFSSQAMANANRESLVWPTVTRAEPNPWGIEPDVGRVADGIPARVDRLRALGNAVVPAIAEHVARIIMTNGHMSGLRQ
jgi:DNA-methyltransferase (dcm)